MPVNEGEYIPETAVFETLPDFLWPELGRRCAVCGERPSVFQFSVEPVACDNPTEQPLRRTYCCVDCACQMLRAVAKRFDTAIAVEASDI
jgi:hypothetical protein